MGGTNLATAAGIPLFWRLQVWIKTDLAAAELLPAYLAAVGAVALASLVNFLWQPSLGPGLDTRYFTLLAAVFVGALYGGLGPGVLATALGALSSAILILPPYFSLRVTSPEARERLTIFVIEGVLISVVGHVVRRSDDRLASPRPYAHYLAIPISVAGAALIKAILLPDLVREFPFAFNYAAICVSAWLGGVRAGVATTILSAVVTRFFFLPPMYSLAIADGNDAVRLALFGAEGLLLSLLNGRHLQLQRFAQSAAVLAQQYLKTALHGSDSVRAIRAISRDTIWEWAIESGDIVRTPSWQDSVSSALPEREDFDGWVNRIHREDRGSALAILMSALNGGREECRYRYRLLRRDGTYVGVSDHAFIVRDDDWKAIRVIGRSAELSRNTAPRVHPDEERFARMFEESPIATLIVDSDLRILFTNPSARGLLRARSSTLQRADFLPFLEAASHAEVLGQFTSLFSWRRLSIHFEQTVVPRTGARMRVTLNAVLITDFYAGTTGCLVLLDEIP